MSRKRPLIADLFCGAGGAAMGLHRAGFDVVGFDIKPQTNYPFDFVLQDALTVDLSAFDAVWASPPCQGYSIMNNLPWNRDREYPYLILPTREMFLASGKPYIIENVGGARYGAKGLKKRNLETHGLKAAYLCGTMFGLPFYRHRYFESDWFWMQPGHPNHESRIRSDNSLAGRPTDIIFKTRKNGRLKDAKISLSGMITPEQNGIPIKTGLDRRFPDGTRQSIAVGAALANWQYNGIPPGVGHTAGWRLAAEAMGINWMKREELTQAIPPVYSEFIGQQLIKHVK